MKQFAIAIFVSVLLMSCVETNTAVEETVVEETTLDTNEEVLVEEVADTTATVTE
jgi:hypothetical protein